jgi:cyanate permease
MERKRSPRDHSHPALAGFEGDTEGVTEQYSNRYRWVILAAFWLTYAGMGAAMSSMAPLVTPILSDLKMSYSEMGIILGSWQLAFIPFSLIAGIAIDKWGIHKTLFAGALIVALSVTLRYYAGGFITLLPMVALFGVGGPLIATAAPKLVSMWFAGHDRATAVGIYTTAPSVGTFFALAATNSLIMPLTGQSWRLTLVLYGLLVFVIALLWLLFGRDTGQTRNAGAMSLWFVFVGILRVHNVRVVLVAALLLTFIIHGFGQWLPKMLEDAGISAQSAGLMASIASITGIPSALVIPRVVPRHLRSRTIALFAALISAGVLISASASSWSIVGLVLYGIALGAFFPLLMLVLIDDPSVGSGTMGLAGGILFAVAQIGGFAGPTVTGNLVAATGSFHAGIWALATAGALVAALSFALRMPGLEPSVVKGTQTQ